MKKLAIFSVFAIFLILVLGCQKTVEIPHKGTAAPVADTGDSAVDSVGAGITETNDVAEELNVDDLNNIDAGLADIENI